MIFPDLSADEVLRRTAAHWSFDGPYPVPIGGWLRCPVCTSTEVQGRAWRYHKPAHSVTLPHRCDVTFKCTMCAHVWLHGVVVTEDYWEANARHVNTHVRWRRVLKDLENGQ